MAKINGKALLSSKTFWFNAVWVVLTVVGWFGFGEFQPDPKVVEWMGTVGAIVNILLRVKTTQPIKSLA